MIELLRINIKIIKSNSFYTTLSLTSKEYYMATIHRQSNTSVEKIKEILSSFNNQKHKVLFCVHPRTSRVITNNDIKIPENVMCIKPVGFLEILNLLFNSRALFTDSGGLQKEAYELEVPCFTLRENTEWKELVVSGWNVLGMPTEVENNIEHILKQKHPQLYLSNSSDKIIDVISMLK